ncbi:MAG: methyl-accepting chemotaxis protein [Burkholderiales bacterium]
MRKNLPVTDYEHVLDGSETLVSTTDVKGKITYANPYFVEVSGFTEEELIGAPHNIVRHPDMPAEAFEDLWTTVQSGQSWSGVVKNRCKNGDYYWVMANVTPLFNDGKLTGYMSVRSKPSLEQVDAASRLYKSINAGNPDRIVIRQGAAIKTGMWSRIFSGPPVPLARRVMLNVGFIALLLAAASVLVWCGGSNPILGTLIASAMLAVIYFWYSLRQAIVAPLRMAMKASQAMSGCDMTMHIDIQRRDVGGQLLRSLRQLNVNVSSLIGSVRNDVSQIGAAAHEVSVGNMDLSARTEAQASSLEQTSASMEELAATVQQNSDHAAEANGLATDARNIAEKGGAAVEQVVSSMHDINASFRQIVEIIGLIDSFAFQTNILALNAAVEAARAGEHGRGFAVVATEVRSLAQRSAVAAKEIKSLVGASVAKVDAGVNIADDAGRNMNSVIAAIARLSGIVGEISAASTEQSAGIRQVKDAIIQMDQVTQQNATMVEEVAAAARVLEKKTLALSTGLKIFKLPRAANGSDMNAAPQSVRALRVPRPAAPSSVASIKPISRRATSTAVVRSKATGTDNMNWEEF